MKQTMPFKNMPKLQTGKFARLKREKGRLLIKRAALKALGRNDQEAMAESSGPRVMKRLGT